MVEDAKVVKNQLHIDVDASGDRADRLVGLGATRTCVMFQEGVDHYAVGMKDPEGNEFDIN